MDTILQPRTLLRENHPGTEQLSLIAQLRGRNPDFGQGTAPLQAVHPSSIQSIGLVHRGQHHLGTTRMDQFRHHARLFDLLDNPVPIAHRLHGYRGSVLELLQESVNRSWLVLDTRLPSPTPVGTFD
ncbi:MAG: hypothetical protein ABSG38_12750 [Spirochaetia bacterium]